MASEHQIRDERGYVGVDPHSSTTETLKGLAHWAAMLRRQEQILADREAAADTREELADRREATADTREELADRREATADTREELADRREATADTREQRLSALERSLHAHAAGAPARSDIADLLARESIQRARAVLAASAARLDRSEAALARSKARRTRQQDEVDRAVADSRRRLDHASPPENTPPTET